MIRRLAVVAAFAAALGILSVLAAEPRVPDPPEPVPFGAIDRSPEGSNWFCAAASANTSDASTHQILISNSSQSPFKAVLTGFRQASNATTVLAVDVPMLSMLAVDAADIAPDVGGVAVEVLAAGGSVAHRLTSDDALDQSLCATDAAAEWFFPAADTQRGRSARLWLLNPFAVDASVDVSVSTVDSVRVPKELTGVIVPAGSSRMVELGDTVQRRDQFAFTVTARAGLLVAELAQAADGTETEGSVRARGIRLDPGRPATHRSWVFGDGFGGEGVSDRIVVYNPTKADSTIQVAVFPAQSAPEELPEPFELTIPSRRFAAIVLDQETRIPPGGLRWARVDVQDGGAVVVGHLQGLFAEGGNGSPDLRPVGDAGIASSTGSPWVATRWVVPAAAPPAEGQSLLVITNPDPETIAVTSVAALVDGKEIEVLAGQEVAAGSTLVVDLAGVESTSAFSAIVNSTSPVLVESRSSSKERDDFTMLSGVPDAAAIGPIVALGG